MASSRHLEIEHKYDVSVDAVIPDLSGIEGIERIGEPTEHVLVASYFDTADLDLARHHVTLRRRRGGSDEGWHLKIETAPTTGRSTSFLWAARPAGCRPRSSIPFGGSFVTELWGSWPG